MKELSIVIAVYGESKYLRGCLDSLKRYISVDYELQIIDTLKNKMSISKTWNQGIIQSDSENILILNDDTIFTEGCYDLMKAELVNPRVGIVVPSLNCKGYNDQNGQCEAFLQLKIEKEFDDYSIENADFVATLLRNDDRLIPIYSSDGEQWCGCCMLFKRSLVRECGGFDERFVAYSEDTDYFGKVGAMGYSIVQVQRAFIFHYGGGTARNKQFDKQKSYKLFKENKMKRQQGIIEINNILGDRK